MTSKISGIVTEIKARNTRVGDMYDVVVNGVAYGNGKYPPRGVKAQFPARLYVGGEVGRLQRLLREQALTLQVAGVRPFGSLSAADAAPEEAEDGAQLSPD